MNEEKTHPIPLGLETAYTFESRSNRRIPTYEAPVISNTGAISTNLCALAMRFFAERGWEGPTKELGLILKIDPASDILLADYRALRLRAFFVSLTTTILNSIVSPDGTSNAARVFSGGGGPGVFSELARVLMAALLSGKDESISAALRVYFMSVSLTPVPSVVLGASGDTAGRIVKIAGSSKPMPDGNCGVGGAGGGLDGRLSIDYERLSTDRGNVSPE